MEVHTQPSNPRHDAAVNSVATFLHDDMGVEDNVAHARATDLVAHARESVARVESLRARSLGPSEVPVRLNLLRDGRELP